MDATIFSSLDAAEDPVDIWDAVLNGGKAALKNVTENRATGPRHDIENEDAEQIA